jgi:tetratricopeptide (TPR) repeat protein
LALLYWAQGRYREAEPLYQRVLTGYEKVLGTEHLDTLTSVNDLALLYWAQGRYDEAESLYQRALTGYGKVLGTEHPKTLINISNLANLYRDQGDCVFHGFRPPIPQQIGHLFQVKSATDSRRIRLPIGA